VVISGLKLSGRRIIGDPKLFSLQERIFITVCIISFIALCLEVPINFFLGLFVPAYLCLFGVFFTMFLYYISRFKRRCAFAIKLFCIVCNFVFAINYFFNSGIYGPNLLLFSLVFLLIVSVIPKAHFKLWIAANFLTVIGILVLEYLYPHWAPNAYKSELSKVLDFAITYAVVIVLTYFSISYIRKNYDVEKEAVLEKNMAIEAQKIELERLSAEKDKLFSIVTHDLKNPLASIQGYLELLTEVEISDAEKLEIKKQLLQITRDTSTMLTNVLSWTTTQLVGSQANLEKINVSDTLRNSLSIEMNISVKKGLKLEIKSSKELDIIADPNMLQLVLRNLVNNAIKFTPTGGLVEVEAVRNGNECLIMVKDNGLGITLAQQEKLFRLNAMSTYGTNEEKGIGLGLLLCKEYTEKQNGKIWFEDRVQGGSTFCLGFKLI
jgi:two-component system sensor histidine kinase/response regulator